MLVGDALLQQAEPARAHAPLRSGRRATDKPMLLYNIPGRTATNMPPDLLAELAQIEGIDGVKQANADELQPIDGLELYAGDDAHVRAHARPGRRRRHPRRQPHRRQRDAPDGRRARAPRRDRRLAARRLRDAVPDGQPDLHEGGAEPARPRGRRPAPAARRGDRARSSRRCARCSCATACSRRRRDAAPHRPARPRRRRAARELACASCRSAGWARSART